MPTRALTGEGVAVGTVPYMSPEPDYAVFMQAGKPRFMTDRMLLKFHKPGGSAG